MPAPLVRIGLTGGIGSGKSTVAQTLAECGASEIDADAISRRVTGTGGAAMAGIASRFGRDAIKADGSMDRDWVRQLVFGNPAMRRELEAIIHPLVREETLRQSQEAVALGKACLVFDVPLLVESGRWRQQLDRVVVVDCSEATQIARVLARESGRAGWTEEVVKKIISGQATRSERLAAADVCVFNDGLSLAALQALVRQLARGFGL
jgi:dephospho-CoA kinase